MYKSMCIVDVAVAKQDVSLCEKLSDSEDKEGCIRDVAVAKQK